MKRIVSLLLALAMVFALVACGSKNTNSGASAGTGASEYKYTGPRMTIGGADSTGPMYAAAAAIATTLTGCIDGLNVDATTSSGSNENAINVSEGTIELGMCSADAGLNAFTGAGKFASTGACGNLRVLGAVYPALSHFITLRSSGIEYMHDLAKVNNPVIGIGPAASTCESSATLALETMGVTKANATLQNVTLGDGADNVVNGVMTASAVFAGIPAGVFLNASVTKDCVFPKYTDEELDIICEKNAAYYKAFIPAGTYTGLTEDLPTFGVKTLVICSEDLDDELAYQIAKTFYEQAEDMAAGNSLFNFMLDRTFLANDVPLPLHPGAERFYREIGLLQ